MNLRIQTFLIILTMLLGNSLKSMAGRPAYLQGTLQEEPKWATYFARGEEFSVLLSEIPSIALKDRVNKEMSARYLGRIYGAYENGIVYLIISENNPSHAEKLD